MTVRCKPGAHVDVRMRGGKHTRCRLCGDVFPCRHACEHLDCIVATARELPANVGAGARDAIVAELAARGLPGGRDAA
jgi:hypothetical protein